METIEGQLAYIEQTLLQAKKVTSGLTQHKVNNSLDMMPLVKSGVQNMRARASWVDDE